MNRKTATILIIGVMLLFVCYIVYDVAFRKEPARTETSPAVSPEIPDNWRVSATIDPASGKVKAVGVMRNGNVIIGGDSFLACYDPASKMLRNIQTGKEVSSIATSGDTIFAATTETILLFNIDGKQFAEWGPYEDSAMITSVAVNNSYVVFADAHNKVLMLLDKKGNLKEMLGKSGEPFILPSPYFDVAIDQDNYIYVANTGRHRMEKRKTDGTVISMFGEPGTAPELFAGCCNPAHFTLIPGGIITAEKGINRIKILSRDGKFVEFISSVNEFVKSAPLDVASADGKIVYGAYQPDSKVFVFVRK
ncbi:MAG: hypothetical protein U0T33_05235 [Bacteroidales bacterium]